MQDFCEVCGAVEDLAERALRKPDEGTAKLCGSCWKEYLAQLGISELIGPPAAGAGAGVAVTPSRVRRGILGD